MAKPDTDATYKAFLADVLAHVPEDKRATIEEALSADDVKKTAAAFVMTRSDYSRSMDEITAKERELSTIKQQNLEWYQTAATQYTASEAEKADLKRKLAEYEATHGALTADERRTAATQTPEQFEASLLEKLRKERAQESLDGVRLMGIMTELGLDHRETFKEKLDTDKLSRFAFEKGLPLTAAYKELYADKFAERDQASTAKALAAAKEEGRREALSQATFPGSRLSKPALDFAAATKHSISNAHERALAFRDNFMKNVEANPV